LTIIATSSSNLFVHWTADEICTTETSCATTTVSCISCASVPDCEGVPGGSAQPGTPCDDGDPGTAEEVYDEDCNCGGGVPVATNDEPCIATALACGDTLAQSLIGSTASLDDACFGTGTSDVWFSFTTDGTQIVTVAEISSFDAVVQLFSGDDCENLVEAGACKDGPENYTITEAGTYHFRVRPYYESGNSGS